MKPSAPRMEAPRTIRRHHHLPGRRRPSGRVARPAPGARHPRLPGPAGPRAREPRPEPRGSARGGISDAVLAGSVRHRPAAAGDRAVGGEEPVDSELQPGEPRQAPARQAYPGSKERGLRPQMFAVAKSPANSDKIPDRLNTNNKARQLHTDGPSHRQRQRRYAPASDHLQRQLRRDTARQEAVRGTRVAACGRALHGAADSGSRPAHRPTRGRS